MNSVTILLAALWFFLPSLGSSTNIRAKLQARASSEVKTKSISTTINRISNGISAQQTNFSSSQMSYSDNGRYVVFQSDASNLVSGDINGLSDVFLFDSQTSVITRLSIGVSSTEANAPSFDPVISGDGNYVAFVSFASNLVANDTNGKADIFRVNLSTNAISRISVDSNSNEVNGGSGEPSISYDGNLISFTSYATNLVATDTNAVKDVFLRNISAGSTSRLSTSSAGTQGDKDSYQSKISSDGSVVVFTSDATNLVGSDSNSCSDVFLKNINNSAIQVISSSTSGVLGNRSSYKPAISSDGHYVVFQSRANNLIASDTNGYIDVFMKNTSTGATALMSQTSSGTQVKLDSVSPSISLDGRFVVFESPSPGYVTWDINNVSDVFIHDNSSGLTTPYSSLANNTLGNAKSFGSRISGDGTTLGFESLSTNFVTPDTNGQFDLFTRPNPLSGQVVNISAVQNLSENGNAQDAILLTRYGDISQALTVYYSIAGTATASSDYTALSGSVIIPANSSTVSIQVTPLIDQIVEANESIILSLSDNAGYTQGGKDTATVQILANDEFTINIVATDNLLSEDGGDRGNFQITRTGGTLGDLIVNLGVSGTAVAGADYVSLPSAVVIPAGQSSVDLAVSGLEDQFGEMDESIILTIASGAGYQSGSSSTATATLKDNDLFEVSIQVTDSVLNKSNVSDTGTFRISRGTNSFQSLVVSYSTKGTAINGVDYQTLSGTATIPAGSLYIDVPVTAIASTSQQGFKSIIIDIIPGSSYSVGPSQSGTLLVKEDSSLPIVSIEATDSNALEDGTDSGILRITRTGSTSSNLSVSYAVAGTSTNGIDYTSIASSATIPTGQTYVDIVITGTEDTLVEPTETVILALQSTPSYLVDPVLAQAQVNLLDNDLPTVQIFRDSAFATESQTLKAKVRLTRTGNLTNALTVNLTMTGTPLGGIDYVSPGSSIVIPAGAASKIIEIPAISDNSIEGNELLLISIGANANYAIGSASSTEVSVIDGSYNVFKDILGIVPNADISSLSISDDGRFLTFTSEASNLVAADNNGVSDVFVVDTTAKTISRLMALNGVEPNGPSSTPSMSANGRFVTFSSRANNFYQEDQNQNIDIFLADLSLGTLTYVSKGYTYLSQGGDSLNPQISSNGDFVVFESNANNLVDQDTNNKKDIFHYTRSTGALTRINLKSGGSQFTNDSSHPSVSADGNLIAFESTEQIDGDSDSYIDVLLKNRATGNLKRASYPVLGLANDGYSNRAKISADGTSLVFQSSSSKILASDVNAVSDVFRYAIGPQQNEGLSKSIDGWFGNRASTLPSVGFNGEFTLFVSNSRNFGGSFNCTTSAYVKSLSRKSISSVQNGSEWACSSPVREASISNSGQFVASIIASTTGFKEIVISSNPLK